jgi:hypothetical protein
VFLGLAYATVLRIAWQFQFYLRTDGYVLVSTVLGLQDLHGAARFLLADRWGRLLGRPALPDGRSRWSQRELWHARWYAVLYPVGYAVSIYLLVVAAAPAVVRICTATFGRLLHPDRAGVGGVADSVVFLLLNIAQLVVVAELARRARRARRARAVAG